MDKRGGKILKNQDRYHVVHHATTPLTTPLATTPVSAGQTRGNQFHHTVTTPGCGGVWWGPLGPTTPPRPPRQVTTRSEYGTRVVATVYAMDVKVDPERDRVEVLADDRIGTWHVALVLGSVTRESGGHQEASRLAQVWRDALGLVGPEWVRREGAAERLGVSVKMVDKLRRAGRLRGRRVGRTNRAYVHRDDLTALLAERGA